MIHKSAKDKLTLNVHRVQIRVIDSTMVVDFKLLFSGRGGTKVESEICVVLTSQAQA